jgi:hypothetical protein
MPRVFRAMRKDEDGLPHIERSASGLGVRLDNNKDLDVEPDGTVLVNGKGMSVSPGWRELPLFRIPERLRHIKREARGSNHTFCFHSGTGPFVQGVFCRWADTRARFADTRRRNPFPPVSTRPEASRPLEPPGCLDGDLGRQPDQKGIEPCPASRCVS